MGGRFARKLGQSESCGYKRPRSHMRPRHSEVSNPCDTEVHGQLHFTSVWAVSSQLALRAPPWAAPEGRTWTLIVIWEYVGENNQYIWKLQLRDLELPNLIISVNVEWLDHLWLRTLYLSESKWGKYTILHDIIIHYNSSICKHKLLPIDIIDLGLIYQSWLWLQCCLRPMMCLHDIYQY